MKLMKKILSAAAALCLLLAILPSASADGDSDALFKDKTWEQVMENFLAEMNVDESRVAVGYMNTVTGEEHYINEDSYMVAGSMYKVPLNMYYAEMVYNGEMDWDSEVYGISYNLLMDDSIINSNNDYAEILWRNLGHGSYSEYRRLIAPYMGEDPDKVDSKYYENNFFTPRQMIFCLNLLQTQSERFPKIIETMQKAEPSNYFKLNEQRFDIAHKYGFLQEEYHLYLNDCGIAYTDEPIAIVMFTDNVSNAYDVLTEYCTLMCDYTQYNTALRLEEEARQAALAAAETPVPTQAVTATPVPLTTQAPDSAPADTGTGFSSVVTVALVVIAVIAALAAAVACRRKRGINLFWAILAIVLAGGAMLLCIVGVSAGTIIAKPQGDPQETVTVFMDALTGGDYATAYSQLSGYSSLGLENQPADQVGSLVYDALRESFSYELDGECVVDKLDATQQLQFTYLDLSGMAGDVETETMSVLTKIVQTRSRSQIYDSDNNYLPEVAQEAYSTAVKNVLEHAEDYYTTTGIQLQISYTGGSWRIVPSQSLLKAITGGAY